MNLTHTLFEPVGDGPHPAIIVFHGWGASALDLLGLAPYVCAGRFLVICPQGPFELPLSPTPSYGWYPIQMGVVPDPGEIDAATAIAQKFIDAALGRYPVDRRKLVALGFSQGGTMACRVAFAEPEKFAALVAISTRFSPEFRKWVSAPDALEKLPTLIQHGRADNVIDVAHGRQGVELMREMRVPLTYREYDSGHEITAENLRDLSEFLTDKVLSPIITP